MGMDVTGKSGNYFRANMWSWRPINELCKVANDRFLKGRLNLHGWAYNGGNGLRTQEDCDDLANALEQLLAEMPQTIEANPPKHECRPEDSLVELLDPDRFKVHPEKAEYSVQKTHAEEFVKFLRECGGGFEIW